MDQAEGFRDYSEADARIRRAVDSLQDYDSPDFWSAVTARGNELPPEVLVRVLRELRALGRDSDVERATDLLIQRAYGIAAGIIGRRLRSRPWDHEDAIADALARLWQGVHRCDTFWERNFIGALQAACISACRKYLAEKRSDIPFSEV